MTNGITCKKMSTVSMITSPSPRGLCNLLPFSKPLDKPILNYPETELLFYRVTGVPFLPKWANKPKSVLGIDLEENVAPGMGTYVTEI